MSPNYQRVWTTMNDMNETITNMVQVKNLLEVYAENKNDKFLDCLVTLLDHYIDVQDTAFNAAWKETVVAYDDKDDCMPPWGHSDLEYLCHHSGSTVSNVQYTDEELDAMCDAAFKKDKVKKWVIPVELDGLTGDLLVTFPDDLLEQTGWKEGDSINFEVNADGSIMVSSKTTPFDDGFRITD